MIIDRRISGSEWPLCHWHMGPPSSTTHGPQVGCNKGVLLPIYIRAETVTPNENFCPKYENS